MVLAAALTVVGTPARAITYLPDPTNPTYYQVVGAAGQDLTVDQSSQITGDLHANEDVTLDAGVVVTGDVSATGIVINDGTVTGTVTQGAVARSLPTLPTEAEARALADRIFEGDTAFANGEVIDDIVFVNGDARFYGSLNGTGAVIAMRDIRLLKMEQHGQLLPTTMLSLVAHGDIRLDRDRELRGVLLAGEDIEIKKQSTFEGVALSHWRLDVDRDSQLSPVSLDTVAPVVSDLEPPDGATLNTSAPVISASFTDNLSGIALAAVALTVDSNNVTDDAAITESSITYAPPSLADGPHSVTLQVEDNAGNPASATWSFSIDTQGIDTQPPTLTIVSPQSGTIHGLPAPVLEYSDAESGVDLTSLLVLLDGGDITSSCFVEEAAAYCDPQVIPDGSHTVTAHISDMIPNQASATVDFNLDLDETPPVLTLTEPEDGEATAASSIVVAGTTTDDVLVESVEINGSTVPLDQGTFSQAVQLIGGLNLIQVVATDGGGNPASLTRVVTMDTAGPTIEIASPLDGSSTNADSVLVAGTAIDVGSSVAGVSVNGVTASLNGEQFEALVPVNDGTNTLTALATDLAGNSADDSIIVEGYMVPSIEITTPADLVLVGDPEIAVSGIVSGSIVSATVNGAEASVQPGSFSVASVPLHEGTNILTATATDSAGRVGTHSIVVVRDSTPPRVSILHPEDGSVVRESPTGVWGLVNDIVPGTVNSDQAVVTVNGQPAEVSNRGFFLEALTLTPGVNTIDVVATDAAGNSGQALGTVTLDNTTSQRLSVVSGAGQLGTAGTTLPGALTVQAIDAAGAPAQGVTVLFELHRSDGLLNGSARQVAVVTDGSGLASATFTLGTRAGVGVQEVSASAVGYGPPVPFSASVLAAPPGQIAVDSGTPQIGQTGEKLPRPLVAIVTDAYSNRLENVPVRFRVLSGGGSFDAGAPELVVATDADGRAIASLTLGPEEGVATNIVEASVDGTLEIVPVSFVASSLVAGEPSQTAVAGIVLDNSDIPIPGVTVSVGGTPLEASTDAEGRFSISGVPVGMLHLEVDGSTATRPGDWASLAYTLTTIAGRTNTLGMPIYLLPLEVGGELCVDATTGGTLTMPGYPGFALDIVPGSVTFPDGSQSGCVRAVAVHNDKVPMPPSAGQQPDLVVTIQPPGAEFDPPAKVTFPNTAGLLPGRTVEFMSFDHDLEQFVSVGPATIREDGLVGESLSGSGIVKAGWHWPWSGDGCPLGGGGGEAHAQCGPGSACGTCKACRSCGVAGCAPDPLKDGTDDNGKCPPGTFCSNGECQCAYPVAFRLDPNHTLNDIVLPDGSLFFRYIWESSTGPDSADLADLSLCQIAERVDYPSPNGSNPFQWPAPWLGFSSANPTEIWGNAKTGWLTDHHATVFPAKPYLANSFTALQRYGYTCPCKNNGNVVVLRDNLAIFREIYFSSPTQSWIHRLIKEGIPNETPVPP